MYKIIALPTKVAALVRATLESPGYGHPAHVEVATGHGPCRHCLRTFEVGVDRRILFTYDPFHGLDEVPLPGPVFVCADGCERYEGGFPEALRAHALVLYGQSRGAGAVARLRVNDGNVEPAIERLFAHDDVEFIHVHDASAGCFDLRVERVA